MKLLIVLVNYKGYQLTADCLETVAPQVRAANATVAGHYHVGVCDNGSGNGDDAKLAALIAERGWSDWCTLTPIHPNRGFTGGNNAVITPYFADAAAAPEYVLLLNNDTLLRDGALDQLVAFMDTNPQAGLAGSRLEHRDGTPQVSAFRFFNLVNELESTARLGPLTKLTASHNIPLPVFETPTRVDWVAGASLIIRRAVVEKVGLLDEGFYTYFDDIDYCRSAKRAGFDTWYVPASRIVHLVGQTTGITAAGAVKRRPGYWFEARRRYWLKHHGPLTAAAADAAFVIGTALYRTRLLFDRADHHGRLPARFLRDFVANSTFARGFKLEPVKNPALA